MANDDNSRDNSTRALAEWVESVRVDELPLRVIDRVGYLLLDLLGVSVSGIGLESSRAARRFVDRWGGGYGMATVLGSQTKARPAYAALANGITGHGPELDDVTEESSLHPGVVNLTALLSAAEEHGESSWDSRRFIEAAVVAYEITIRVGNAVNVAKHYARGFHPTATAGTFGAAAGVAKYMGLKARAIQHALGLAGSQAAGSMAYLQDGSWAKRFNAGWAAHSGIIAAQLVESGMTGPQDIFTGREGFFQAYTEQPFLERLTDGLGDGWAIEEVAIKPYGCCRYCHSAIDAALALRSQGLRPDEIKRAQIVLPTPALLLVGEPQERKRAPLTSVDAQFSVHFATLLALATGHADPDDFLEPGEFKGRHPEIERFDVGTSSEVDQLFPQHWATRLLVETHDGRMMERLVLDPKGSPQNPLSWDELVSRFRRLGARLSAPIQDELIQGCRELMHMDTHPYRILTRGGTVVDGGPDVPGTAG